MSEPQTVVTAIVALLSVALAARVVADRVRVPYVVALLLVAAPVELPGTPSHFGPAFIFVLLPTLIFEAAWNVDAASLQRNWLAVTMLAIPGVIITAFLVAGGLAFTGQLPFVPALLLGAILAATDPIAVIAVFRRLNVPLELATIVEGESLFNDGAAIVLYGVVVEMLAGSGAVPAPLGIAWTAISVAFGGAFAGLVIAAVVARLLHGIADVQLQVVGTIVAAFGSYLLADELHFSGIFAAVVAGIALRAFPRFSDAGSERRRRPLLERYVVSRKRVRVHADGFANRVRSYFGRAAFRVVHARARDARRPTARLCGATARAEERRAELEARDRNVRHARRAVGAARDRTSGKYSLSSRTRRYRFGVVFVTLVAQGLGIGPLISRLKLDI